MVGTTYAPIIYLYLFVSLLILLTVYVSVSIYAACKIIGGQSAKAKRVAKKLLCNVGVQLFFSMFTVWECYNAAMQIINDPGIISLGGTPMLISHYMQDIPPFIIASAQIYFFVTLASDS